MGLRLHFLRHGQTAYSRDNLFCGSGLDPALTPEGAEMAQAFVSAYGNFPWSAVYASPLERAAATARPLGAAKGMKITFKDGLREIGYGRWEGRTSASVNREFHRDFVLWTANPARRPPTDGEKATDVEERGMRVIHEIQSNHTSGDVLIVSHKATIRIILCSLLGLHVGRFRYRLACPVGSVSVLEVGTQGFLLRSLADCSHLGEKLRSLPGS